jgi:hypothetical protein
MLRCCDDSTCAHAECDNVSLMGTNTNSQTCETHTLQTTRTHYFRENRDLEPAGACTRAMRSDSNIATVGDHGSTPSPDLERSYRASCSHLTAMLYALGVWVHCGASNPGRHSTAQHSTAQHSTAQHSTAQHSTAQHSTAQHSTAQGASSPAHGQPLQAPPPHEQTARRMRLHDRDS